MENTLNKPAIHTSIVEAYESKFELDLLLLQKKIDVTVACFVQMCGVKPGISRMSCFCYWRANIDEDLR